MGGCTHLPRVDSDPALSCAIVRHRLGEVRAPAFHHVVQIHHERQAAREAPAAVVEVCSVEIPRVVFHNLDRLRAHHGREVPSVVLGVERHALR